MDSKRVPPREIAELLRDLRELLELGDAATYEQWLAYHERKADVLQRIAVNPGELIDATEATHAAQNAARQVDVMRRHPCRIGGDQSCP
jgi:hypothetical protein